MSSKSKLVISLNQLELQSCPKTLKFSYINLLIIYVTIIFANNTIADRLLLISFDGFRYDYLTMYPKETRNLQNLAKLGLKAKYTNSQYITKTFPNHWSIVTGLYEDSHGIINNYFYDPKFNSTFEYSIDDKYWSGEPIWHTFEKQTKKRAAVYYWPGSEVSKFAPSYYIAPYNSDVPYKSRADQTLKWLRDINIGFMALYVNEPDSSGHKHGPKSEEVRQAILKVDDLLGYILLEVLNNPTKYKDLNIIVTSDHGMTELSKNKNILLEKYFSKEEMEIFEPQYVDITTGAYVWCDESTAMKYNCDYFYKKIKNLKIENLIIYKKHEIPKKLHYSDNYRIPPIYILTVSPWQVHLKKPKKYLKGQHGFLPTENEMHPIFIATGKKFIKSKDILDPFSNIHLYELFCKVLEIDPAPNNGTFSVVEHLLKDDGIFWYNLDNINFSDDWTMQKYIGLLCMLGGILVGIFAVFFCDADGRPDSKCLNDNSFKKLNNTLAGSYSNENSSDSENEVIFNQRTRLKNGTYVNSCFDNNIESITLENSNERTDLLNKSDI